MNRLTVFLIIIVVIAAIVLVILNLQQKEELAGPEKSQLPNPAAVFCQEQGGQLEGRINQGGQYSVCLFDDGSECEEWDFFRGECREGDLKTEVLQEGNGEPVKNNDIITVHYVGKLADGTKFDSSYDRGQPFTFVLGAGQVIDGWEQGVFGMKAGEKRKLTISSDLGYGEQGVPGVIPPNAVLIFEVEMLSFQTQ